MADLDAAWIGLIGVAVGGLLTQAADELRWRRDRHLHRADERQAALLDVLRAGSELVARAAAIAEGVASAPIRSKLTLDFRNVDDTLQRLGHAIDAVRVLGPAELVPPSRAYVQAALDFRHRLWSAPAAKLELDQAGHQLEYAREALLDAAARAGVIDAKGCTKSRRCPR